MGFGSSFYHHEKMLQMYEQIAVHAADMADAADAGDWDAVTALEVECAALVAELRVSDKSTPLDAGQRERKAALLTQILKCDAQVRAKACPRLDFLQSQLADARRGARANSIYGVMSRM